MVVNSTSWKRTALRMCLRIDTPAEILAAGRLPLPKYHKGGISPCRWTVSSKLLDVVMISPKKIAHSCCMSPVIAISRCSWAALMAFVCIMTTAEPSPAQVTTGTLQGRVYTIDPDGTRSLIPGATVSVKGPASSQHVATDQQAMYRFPELAPGQYRVEAAAPGLAGSSVALVVPNRVTDVSVELQIALIKETVTVTASAEESPRTETSEQSVIGK